MDCSGGVGLLVPLTIRPTAKFVAAIIELANSAAAAKDFAIVTHDRRMSLAAWDAVVQTELNEMLAWVLRRLSVKAGAEPNRAEISSILSLLPGYGIALHVVRRAAIFAALGIPTTCGFPHCSQESSWLVHEIAIRLGITDVLSVLPCDCASAGQLLDMHNTTVIVTGRCETVKNVARSLKCPRVIGSTGRCSVVVGSDERPVQQLAGVLRHNQLEQSCARVAAVVLATSLSKNARVRILDCDNWRQIPKSLGDYLSELHPSIVVTPLNPTAEGVHDSIRGYRLYYCDGQGVPQKRQGFGADPIYGWPGDYVL